MKKGFSAGLSACLFAAQLYGQNASPVPSGSGSLSPYLFERQSILSGSGDCTALRPFTRRAFVADSSAVDTSQAQTLVITRDQDYLNRDNADFLGPLEDAYAAKKPFLKIFYRQPAHFYHFRHKHFRLSIDPILHTKVGFESETDGSGLLFDNRRGLELRGHIDDKVYYYARVVENQTKFPSWVMRRVAEDQAVPGAGYYKEYNSILSDAPLDGYDYLLAQGLIGFNVTKHVGFQIGHGRNFIGDGHRSLFLSDFSNDYFYLKINTDVWRLRYQNIFAQLTGDYLRGGDQLLPKKFLAAHYLSARIGKNLNVGIFESVMFSRPNGGFELQYLNPLILYRTVEHSLGSPDNVLIGANVKWNLFKHVQLYGQVLLDEFNFKEFFGGSGWWANKFGIQAGAKYVDMFGVRGLDGQLEFNMVRPYTYSHNDSSANYTHYNQQLAHPFGANFRELIGILRYQPTNRLFLYARVNWAEKGLDSLGSNWGGNIFLPNGTYERPYDNAIGQGVNAKMLMVDFRTSYLLFHNCFADLQLLYRNFSTALGENRRSLVFSMGIRLNLADRDLDF
jgi:hypothetical protein